MRKILQNFLGSKQGPSGIDEQTDCNANTDSARTHTAQLATPSRYCLSFLGSCTAAASTARKKILRGMQRRAGAGRGSRPPTPRLALALALPAARCTQLAARQHGRRAGTVRVPYKSAGLLWTLAALPAASAAIRSEKRGGQRWIADKWVYAGPTCHGAAAPRLVVRDRGCELLGFLRGPRSKDPSSSRCL